MSDWGYVAFGYVTTALVVGTYWSWVAVRTRRAAQDLERLKDES